MGKTKAVFVGTGMIGAGLAANAMLNGYETVLYDVVPQEKMEGNIRHIMDILVEAGAATRQQADEALAACRYSNDLEQAVQGAQFVQECIPERLELKKATCPSVIAGTLEMVWGILHENGIDLDRRKWDCAGGK